MHLIRLDIDRKNSAAHLQAGPFGGGLNAVYAPMQGGSATMSRFVRSILFRGNYVNEVFETEEGETIDGSMQWVDSTGHVRMMSFSGGSAMLPGGFVNSPLHPSQRPLHEQDSDRIRGLGNIFWEGEAGDARWDELRGDILGMIFCSPLGSVSPEKLWWSASRLGVHSPARNELDEGYQRLKAEEQDLLDRLRNADPVDHDRAWWALERDRLLAEISHVSFANEASTQPTQHTNQLLVAGLRERLAKIQIELSTLRTAHQDMLVAEANSKLDSANTLPSKDLEAFHNGTLNNISFGRHRADRIVKTDYASEIQRIKTRIERLVAEQADVEIQLRNTHVVPVQETHRRWDDGQLRQQLIHAEEMLRRWDRRTQWHRRLAEVQSHLRTRSPYRRTSDGSLIPLVEKYLRELTAGAARQLPPWAIESSYLRGHDMPVDFDGHNIENGYRDSYYDRRLPSTDSRQRRLVDLAIRLAIAEAAVPRIGRIPFLFDNSIEGFRGEALEQVLHVLAGFARDGRQILLATHDEFVARRIAAHGGTVSRMHEILRYARPRYVMDSTYDLGVHPTIQASAPVKIRGTHYPVSYEIPAAVNIPVYGQPDYSDINRQLTGWANEQESINWWNPIEAPVTIHPTRAAPVGVHNSRFTLHLDSPISEVPTVDASLVASFQKAGIHRVGDLLRTTSESAAASMRVEPGQIYYLQCLAELMTSIPRIGAFDARVLVGCGITRSRMLRDLDGAKLVDRVDQFLRSQPGRELLQTASRYEIERINSWLSSMRGRRITPVRRSDTERRPRRTVRRRESIRAYAPRQFDYGPRQVRYTTRQVGYEPRQFDYEPREFVYAPRQASVETSVRNPGEVSPVRRRERRQGTRASVVSRASESRRSTRGTSTSSTSTDKRWKFYLELDSPVVDAPSIGPKMSEKLAAISILRVADLLSARAESIAEQLGLRYVTTETVMDWQKQAMFVCRVPNLRGHDSQMLVGAGVSSPEELAAADANVLLSKVVQFTSSKAGQRILRGMKTPDIREITDWIHWAQNCRAVRAA